VADLEAHLVAHPDDRDAHLVYADLLQSRGDPRGELIVVQAEREDAPDDAALRARERELIAAHGRDWLGALAELFDKDFAATWRYGFVRAVRFGPPPGTYDSSAYDPALVAHVVALPHAELVRELAFGSWDGDGNTSNWQPCVDAIAAHGLPPNLERLALCGTGYWMISAIDLGDLSPAYGKLASLRELSIEMGAMTLGDVVLPELRALTIVTGGLTSANLASLRAATWPRLERLSLAIGQTDGDHGCDVQLADLAWIFAGENLANVRHLGLSNSSLADDIARALATSRILPQLDSLDLGGGTLSDDGARAIVETPAFARLRELDVGCSFIGEDMAARLAALGPRVALDDPQTVDAWGNRYVQVSE
jgi:uncharacterized protein (TIGR02996 family)